MSLPLLMSDLSNLFTCQFCTCSLDYGCCILLGNLTRRDPRRRKWKKYVSFFQYSRCLCIAQLICFIVYHVLVLNMGGLENVHYCFGVWFYLLVHYIFPCLPAVLDILPSTNINIMWILLNNFVYGLSTGRLNVCILE